MTHFFYLAALLVAISGLFTIDAKYKLAFFYDRARTIKVIGIGMAVFIVWDILGIVLGIFLHGDSAYSLPFVIAPQFPIEELFFLFLLNYTTLILYRGIRR
ncbi:MAG: lycopene cyclase domain-containing protein [Candidatus Microsaccharimonas sp.]